jgi:hypothetical protein
MVSEGILRRNTPKVGNLFECVATARMEDEKGCVWTEIFSACGLSVSEVSRKLRNWGCVNKSHLKWLASFLANRTTSLTIAIWPEVDPKKQSREEHQN